MHISIKRKIGIRDGLFDQIEIKITGEFPSFSKTDVAAWEVEVERVQSKPRLFKLVVEKMDSPTAGVGL